MPMMSAAEGISWYYMGVTRRASVVSFFLVFCLVPPADFYNKIWDFDVIPGKYAEVNADYVINSTNHLKPCELLED